MKILPVHVAFLGQIDIIEGGVLLGTRVSEPEQRAALYKWVMFCHC